jgi:hypothetical protein
MQVDAQRSTAQQAMMQLKEVLVSPVVGWQFRLTQSI